MKSEYITSVINTVESVV